VTHLLDTSILVRLANVRDARFGDAVQFNWDLSRAGHMPCVTPQTLIEFRAVATRPASANGLNMSVAEAIGHTTAFEEAFGMLPDTPEIFPAWKAIVDGLGIRGKQVHDARLAAVCHVHGTRHLVTFNAAHFNRMAAFGPGLTIVVPPAA
jgi:predicted nucleic acid-binding protein